MSTKEYDNKFAKSATADDDFLQANRQGRNNGRYSFGASSTTLRRKMTRKQKKNLENESLEVQKENIRVNKIHVGVVAATLLVAVLVFFFGYGVVQPPPKRQPSQETIMTITSEGGHVTQFGGGSTISGNTFNIGLVDLDVLKTNEVKDKKPDISELKTLADSGDPAVCFELGMRYYHGEGVPKNENEAIQWFIKAAEQDYTVAQSTLGAIYFQRLNYEQAEKYLRSAVKKKDAQALYFLGAGYLSHVYVNEGTSWVDDVNDEYGFILLVESMKQGNKDAIKILENYKGSMLLERVLRGDPPLFTHELWGNE